MINNVLTLESLNLYVLNVLENHNVIALLRQAITELFKRNSWPLFVCLKKKKTFETKDCSKIVKTEIISIVKILKQNLLEKNNITQKICFSNKKSQHEIVKQRRCWISWRS